MGEPVRTHQDLQYDADETAKGAISTAALAPGPKKKNKKKNTRDYFQNTIARGAESQQQRPESSRLSGFIAPVSVIAKTMFNARALKLEVVRNPERSAAPLLWMLI
jgi:hypothetical protein